MRWWLEQDASADLDNAVAEVAAGDGAVNVAEAGRTRAKRSSWSGEVGEVEDVGGLTAKLELHALRDGKVAEDRSVDVTAARSVKSILTHRAIRSTRPRAVASRIGDAGRDGGGVVVLAELVRIDPVVFRRHA